MHRKLWLHFWMVNMNLSNVEAVILLYNVVGSLLFICSKFTLPFQKYKHEEGPWNSSTKQGTLTVEFPLFISGLKILLEGG